VSDGLKPERTKRNHCTETNSEAIETKPNETKHYAWILLRGSERYDLKIRLKSQQTNLGILREVLRTKIRDEHQDRNLIEILRAVLRTKIRDEHQDRNLIVIGGCPGRGGYHLHKLYRLEEIKQERRKAGNTKTGNTQKKTGTKHILPALSRQNIIIIIYSHVCFHQEDGDT